jgi:hypothetical protein
VAIFLQADQIYRLMQRELPEGAYADGAPSGFFTTASIYAKSAQIEKLYTNLQRIYGNMFPQSSVENIHDWEIKVFGHYLPDSLTLEERQTEIVNKLRQHPGINRQSIVDIVRTVIGDQLFTVIDWNCDGGEINGTGVWQIGVSQLGIDTFLGGGAMSDVTPALFPDANFCINDPAFGKTDDEWAAMQEQAYTYEVKIWGYTLTAEQRDALDTALTRGEPARSAHVITDGLDPNDLPSGEN